MPSRREIVEAALAAGLGHDLVAEACRLLKAFAQDGDDCTWILQQDIGRDSKGDDPSFEALCGKLLAKIGCGSKAVLSHHDAIKLEWELKYWICCAIAARVEPWATRLVPNEWMHKNLPQYLDFEEFRLDAFQDAFTLLLEQHKVGNWSYLDDPGAGKWLSTSMKNVMLKRAKELRRMSSACCDFDSIEAKGATGAESDLSLDVARIALTQLLECERSAGDDDLHLRRQLVLDHALLVLDRAEEEQSRRSSWRNDHLIGAGDSPALCKQLWVQLFCERCHRDSAFDRVMRYRQADTVEIRDLAYRMKHNVLKRLVKDTPAFSVFFEWRTRGND